ncbi:MAG: RNA polymerase sigma factor [Clostridiaceae bacterium]|nr:RNA polymerase sigma factor [Clostridiaceae bacterium]
MLSFLMDIAGESDCSLVEQLYLRYRRLVYRVALRILNDQQLAEDAVQETFIKIIHYLERFRTFDCNDMAGLIVIISRNVSIDMLNRQHRKQTISIADVLYDESQNDLAPDDQFIALESHRELIGYIGKLPEQYRDALYLKYIFGFANMEIAEMMNIKPDSVRVWLHRAKQLVLAQWRQDKRPEGGVGHDHQSS